MITSAYLDDVHHRPTRGPVPLTLLFAPSALFRAGALPLHSHQGLTCPWTPGNRWILHQLQGIGESSYLVESGTLR